MITFPLRTSVNYRALRHIQSIHMFDLLEVHREGTRQLRWESPCKLTCAHTVLTDDSFYLSVQSPLSRFDFVAIVLSFALLS